MYARDPESSVNENRLKLSKCKKVSIYHRYSKHQNKKSMMRKNNQKILTVNKY